MISGVIFLIRKRLNEVSGLGESNQIEVQILESLPPENIWNFDETNLAESQGMKEV